MKYVLISARYSDFFIVIASQVRNGDFESCPEPVQSSQNLGDVTAPPRAATRASARWELPATSRYFRRMFHGERSYSGRDGNRPSNFPPCKPSPRRYIHLCIWHKALMLKLATLFLLFTWLLKESLSSRVITRFFTINCFQFLLYIHYSILPRITIIYIGLL